jgi:uncharacterized FAD-dependent dehydrogenase
MKQEMNYGNCFTFRHSASPINFGMGGCGGGSKLSGALRPYVDCGVNVLSEKIYKKMRNTEILNCTVFEQKFW